MLQHYFKIAFRNLAKQKGLTFINIAGLSIGLACFSLFLLYAINEFSFDRFHKNASHIFRVYRWSEAWHGETANGSSYMPMPLGPAMKQELQDVKNYVRINEGGQESFVKANDKVSRIKVSFADPQLFTVFNFKFLSGNPASALNNPGSIVLTRQRALQLFGTVDAIGKTVEIKIADTFEPLVVSAVTENIPANSTIAFDMVASWKYMETFPAWKRGIDNWNRSGYQTYIELQPKSNLMNEKGKLAAFRKKYYPDEETKAKKTGEWKGEGSPISFRLQPLRDMHTNTLVGGGAIEAVSPKNIWILLAIASGVLLIACINFTTLAIGRSAGRAKEVGIRKVIGSAKGQLVFQFLSEAILLSILSAVIGLLLGRMLLPLFNQLSGRELAFSFEQYPEMAWMLLGLVLLVGLLAGSYPSLVLSSFKPVEVLKNKVKVGGANLFTRSLVTVQFILSIGLIIATAIILQQLAFMRHKNPGFNKENVLMVDAEGTDTKKVFPLFKQALAAQPSVVGVAGSELGLGEGTGWSRSGFEYDGKSREVFEYFVDNEYINLMGVKVVAGRNFDPKIASDTLTSVIVNEAMVKEFGWSMNNAVGQELKGYFEGGEHPNPVVIGVVKDFNFLSFNQKIEPQLFHQFHDYAPYKYFVRLKPGNPSEALAQINKAWKAIVPELPLKYDFLDESLNRFYGSEAKWSNIVGWAGGISVFLACLGLLGLAALAAVNRTKEIGIRKVLGASISSIMALLSKDFLKLVLIAFVIASPLAWYFMNKWLNDYAYRIDIGWTVFVITGVLAVGIAVLTISIQSVRAATANPVKNLRTE
jgi:putative ABC transport system permease protein